MKHTAPANPFHSARPGNMPVDRLWCAARFLRPLGEDVRGAIVGGLAYDNDILLREACTS